MHPLIIRVALRLFQSVTLHKATRLCSVHVPLLPMHIGIPVPREVQDAHDTETARVRGCTAFMNTIMRLEHTNGLPQVQQNQSRDPYMGTNPDFFFHILPDDLVRVALLSSTNACLREAAFMDTPVPHPVSPLPHCRFAASPAHAEGTPLPKQGTTNSTSPVPH